jgi:ornithine cyclodeaminase
MKVLFVNALGVSSLLPMAACIDLMREALTSFARGDAVLPLRTILRLPANGGVLGVMPGYLGAPRSFGLKVISVMPPAHDSVYASHQGVVLLFGLEHGEVLAILDASSITAIRTAAASAAATQVLANEDAGDLAILGAGAQGRTHLEALRTVRQLRRVRVWSRSRANAERFAREESAALGFQIEVSATCEDAVRGADLICTTTAAKEPVLRGEWLSPGAHVNAVGACFAAARELDSQAVQRARLFTDCRESCFNESGDFLIARQEGAIDDDHLLGELGELFLGKLAGRTSRADITLFESLGIALEDLAAAHYIHRRAQESGQGAWLDWGGPS